MSTKVLYTEKEIQDRVREIARALAKRYKGKEVVMIGILKGSFVFFSDLLRELYKAGHKKIVVDFMTISSYGTGTTHSGETRVLGDISIDVQDKDVIVVEDIVDSGHTLKFVKNHLLAKKPSSLRFAVFLDKIERREVSFTPDYIGFTLKGKPWIEGYGLDSGEHGRGRPEIAEKNSSKDKVSS